ncbi:MAG: hypothetical protein PHW18_13120 [Sulfuricurvum sp.]|uniref:hypothetical protein n=1 Tax=Sulfuricurvum sp. TaxID=2025608 RepID=UPI002634819A|nr:hypothetical protein [Sulfuricurvum sp.]MDD2830509.1 hypothetical protein [Sulfuricurvum sp.]MDD4950647.1 hypothetical protein [Sulfuricurvum sp.]
MLPPHSHKSKYTEPTQSGEVDEHHREIWQDALNPQPPKRPLVYYVENHNGSIGYAEAAIDFKILTVELLPRLDPQQLGNWMCPVLYLARQTVELCLKALFERVTDKDPVADKRLLGKHDLSALWLTSREWLSQHDYPILTDARLGSANYLVESLHAVDPTGDLFRFAQSKQLRFNKKKSCDRVGVSFDEFPSAFTQTVDLLQHWESVLFREDLCKEQGWEKDPSFNRDAYPKLGHALG